MNDKDLFYRLLSFHKLLDEKQLFENNMDSYEQMMFKQHNSYNPVHEFNVLLRCLEDEIISKLSFDCLKILLSYESGSLSEVVQDLKAIDDELNKNFKSNKNRIFCYNFLSTYYFNKGKF